MGSSKTLYLYDTATTQQIYEVAQEGLDVLFPPGVGWTEVLDCRIAPYDGHSIEENCDYASHVRKQYILITQDQVTNSTPPTAVDVPD